MTAAETAGDALHEVTLDVPGLSATVQIHRHDAVAVLRLCRPAKRNALDDATVLAIEHFFAAPPAWARAVVLDADGPHFCAGLDLAELQARDSFASLQHSRMWHRAFAALEQGAVPVIAALKGAVIGGGLELASAAHLRVAERSTFYALPEAQRGLFVGGGGSVRVPRLIGVHRMADMMLTGRVLDAEEGQALGLSNYLVDDGDGLSRAIELAAAVARNAPISNFAVLQALPRIAEATPDHGYFLEALMASAASSSDEAQSRMSEFLAGRAAKVEQRTPDGGQP